VQLGHQTTVTAGVKRGPSYRPDAAIDCSQLTKCKRARVTEKNRGVRNNIYVLHGSALTYIRKEVKSECALHNFIVLANFVPKIIKLNENLTKL